MRTEVIARNRFACLNGSQQVLLAARAAELAEPFVVQPVTRDEAFQLWVGYESLTRNPCFGRRAPDCRTDQADRDVEFLFQSSSEIPSHC